MDGKEKIVVGAAMALILYSAALTILGPIVLSAQTSTPVNNSGTIKTMGVGVYLEQACTTEVSSISWGIIDPGSNVTKTFYIRNEGNSAATLSKSTTEWNPSTASNYITFNWDYGGKTLSVNEVLQVKFTLSVSSSVTGITGFSFTILIAANG